MMYAHSARALLSRFLIFALMLSLLPLGAVAQPPSTDSAWYQAMQWRLVGPHRGGRVTAVAGHVDQPFTYYMGATGGGVWKTTDGGQSWNNISDGFFTTTTIGAIAVAPSNAEVIYVGTGESPIRGVTTSHGDGVYKSTDGGETWSHVGLRATRQISKIKIHPHNPDIVYVGAQGNPWAGSEARGVYRSTNGGETWERVLYVNPTTGVSLLDIDVNQPDTLYAALWDHQREPWTVRSGGPGSGLWKSNDGGDSWQELTQGLPALMGNTGVTVSPADSNRLYAMIEAAEGGIFRSDDAGTSWQRVNDDAGIRDRGWYYTHIFADPQNADAFYVLAASMVRSTDGGETLQAVQTPHGDNHDLWINPAHPDWMVQGNDGGANVSFNGGQTWSSQFNQPTAQFYRVITDNVWPYRLYGGQQDNSSVRIPSRAMDGGVGRNDWRAVGGGESAHFGFDRDNPTLVYGTSLLGTLTEYNTATGEARRIDSWPYFAGFRPGRELHYRYNWNAPVVVSQHDTDVIYHGAQYVLKSVDRGHSWTAISPDLTRNETAKLGTTGGPIMIEGAGGEHYATLMYIAESPHDANVIWTGSDDGLVHLTRDGGKNWTNVTPRRMPEGQVNAIEVSPHQPAKAIMVMTRYKLNELQPYVYRTADFGKTWQRIDQGLPADAFARVVREDSQREGLLFAGTEGGAFVSFDNGDSWRTLQLNLPIVPITDLEVHGDDLVAATQGRAFWILDGLQPLRQHTQALERATMHLFRPADALRLNTGRAWNEPDNNPPDGAVIYYAFAEAPKDDVRLEILDRDGSVLRTFSSAAAEQLDDGFVKGVDGEPPAAPLPVEPGQNRYVWNLRVEPMTAVADTIRYVSNRPYRVAPGEYTLRLSLADQVETATLQVVDHPLKPRDEAAWREQQALVRTLYQLVNEVHQSTNELRRVSQQVQAGLAESSDRQMKRAGAALLERLRQWEEQVPQAPLPDGLEDRIGYPSHLLSTQILHVMSIVDQGPPVAAVTKERVAALQSRWNELAEDKQQILANELAEFNRRAGPDHHVEAN